MYRCMYTLYKRKVCFSCDVMLSPFSTDRRTKRHSGWYLRCICLSPNEFKYKEVAVVNFTGKIINNSFESPWNAQKMREMKSVRVRDFARVSRVLDVLFLFSVYLGNILKKDTSVWTRVYTGGLGFFFMKRTLFDTSTKQTSLSELKKRTGIDFHDLKR